MNESREGFCQIQRKLPAPSKEKKQNEQKHVQCIKARTGQLGKERRSRGDREGMGKGGRGDRKGRKRGRGREEEGKERKKKRVKEEGRGGKVKAGVQRRSVEGTGKGGRGKREKEENS